MNFTHDYKKCMMTKLKMADPDRKGGSIIYCDCEKALEIIKQTDCITLGIKKIVYLVGWQYNGHDDKYPAFFEVNEGIKRACDKTALDSLLWLIEEAKKYNTIVSVHINFADAYEDSPLFDDFVKAGALIRNAFGKPAKIEKYNGKPCYKVSYKEEWESGLFKKRVDRILDMLPIQQAGTVHVDNFQCYVNRKPYVGIDEMQAYRDKMIDYLAQKGIDITSEFTYREGEGTKYLYGRITRDVTPTRYPMSLLGKIPAVWWVDKMTKQEYFDFYPQKYCGGLPKDKKIRKILYGNIHGEDIWLNDEWQSQFIKDFCMINVPFFYLADKEKKCFGKGKNSVEYKDGTISFADGRIISDGKILKDKNHAVLPYLDGTIVYSEKDENISVYTDKDNIDVYEITPQGQVFVCKTKSTNKKADIKCSKGKAYFLK